MKLYCCGRLRRWILARFYKSRKIRNYSTSPKLAETSPTSACGEKVAWARFPKQSIPRIRNSDGIFFGRSRKPTPASPRSSRTKSPRKKRSRKKYERLKAQPKTFAAVVPLNTPESASTPQLIGGGGIVQHPKWHREDNVRAKSIKKQLKAFDSSKEPKRSTSRYLKVPKRDKPRPLTLREREERRRQHALRMAGDLDTPQKKHVCTGRREECAHLHGEDSIHTPPHPEGRTRSRNPTPTNKSVTKLNDDTPSALERLAGDLRTLTLSNVTEAPSGLMEDWKSVRYSDVKLPEKEVEFVHPDWLPRRRSIPFFDEGSSLLFGDSNRTYHQVSETNGEAKLRRFSTSQPSTPFPSRVSSMVPSIMPTPHKELSPVGSRSQSVYSLKNVPPSRTRSQTSIARGIKSEMSKSASEPSLATKGRKAEFPARQRSTVGNPHRFSKLSNISESLPTPMKSPLTRKRSCNCPPRKASLQLVPDSPEEKPRDSREYQLPHRMALFSTNPDRQTPISEFDEQSSSHEFGQRLPVVVVQPPTPNRPLSPVTVLTMRSREKTRISANADTAEAHRKRHQSASPGCEPEQLMGGSRLMVSSLGNRRGWSGERHRTLKERRAERDQFDRDTEFLEDIKPSRALRQILAKEKRVQEGRGRSARWHSGESQFRAVGEEEAGTAQPPENLSDWSTKVESEHDQTANEDNQQHKHHYFYPSHHRPRIPEDIVEVIVEEISKAAETRPEPLILHNHGSSRRRKKSELENVSVEAIVDEVRVSDTEDGSQRRHDHRRERYTRTKDVTNMIDAAIEDLQNLRKIRLPKNSKKNGADMRHRLHHAKSTEGLAEASVEALTLTPPMEEEAPLIKQRDFPEKKQRRHRLHRVRSLERLADASVQALKLFPPIADPSSRVEPHVVLEKQHKHHRLNLRRGHSKKLQAENHYKHRHLRFRRSKDSAQDRAEDNVTEAISSLNHGEFEKSEHEEHDEHPRSQDHCPSRLNEPPIESDSETAIENITYSDPETAVEDEAGSSSPKGKEPVKYRLHYDLLRDDAQRIVKDIMQSKEDRERYLKLFEHDEDDEYHEHHQLHYADQSSSKGQLHWKDNSVRLKADPAMHGSKKYEGHNHHLHRARSTERLVYAEDDAEEPVQPLNLQGSKARDHGRQHKRRHLRHHCAKKLSQNHVSDADVKAGSSLAGAKLTSGKYHRRGGSHEARSKDGLKPGAAEKTPSVKPARYDSNYRRRKGRGYLDSPQEQQVEGEGEDNQRTAKPRSSRDAPAGNEVQANLDSNKNPPKLTPPNPLSAPFHPPARSNGRFADKLYTPPHPSKAKPYVLNLLQSSMQIADPSNVDAGTSFEFWSSPSTSSSGHRKIDKWREGLPNLEVSVEVTSGIHMDPYINSALSAPSSILLTETRSYEVLPMPDEGKLERRNTVDITWELLCGSEVVTVSDVVVGVVAKGITWATATCMKEDRDEELRCARLVKLMN